MLLNLPSSFFCSRFLYKQGIGRPSTNIDLPFLSVLVPASQWLAWTQWVTKRPVFVLYNPINICNINSGSLSSQALTDLLAITQFLPWVSGLQKPLAYISPVLNARLFAFSLTSLIKLLTSSSLTEDSHNIRFIQTDIFPLSCALLPHLPCNLKQTYLLSWNINCFLPQLLPDLLSNSNILFYFRLPASAGFWFSKHWNKLIFDKIVKN